MKRFLAIAVIGAVALAFANPALAKKRGGGASQREYQRGYNDCSVGKYDQDQHGASYKKGCRAAEDKKGATAPACPPDVSEANRYQYPGCK